MQVPRVYSAQLDTAINHGWLVIFQREAKRIGETTAQLLAIGSRESEMRNVAGDYDKQGNPHGFGVMQVDVGTDPSFTARWSSANAEPGIIRGADIYLGKLNDVYNSPGKALSVKNHEGQVFRFTGRAVQDDDARRIATACYNNGRWPLLAWSKHQHIDSYTTKHDYGRDVYFRAIMFAALLDSRKIEPGALLREVQAQGDYALDEHQRLVGIEPTGEDKEALPRANLGEVLGGFAITAPALAATAAAATTESTANPTQNTLPPAVVPVAQAAGIQPQALDGQAVQAAGAAGGGQPVVSTPDTPPVRVFLQTLKTGWDDITVQTGLTITAVIAYVKANTWIIYLLAAAVILIYFYRKYGKLQIDKLVLAANADPTKHNIMPDKKAR